MSYIEKFETVIVKERLIGFNTWKIQVVPNLRNSLDPQDQEMDCPKDIALAVSKGLNEAYNAGRNDLILEQQNGKRL